MKNSLLGVNALVVEDDPDTGDLLTFALEGRGATCRHAHSGAAALAAVQASVPDILLCDIMLPDGSALDWLPRLRAVPGASAVPAVAISGHSTPADRERSLAAGFEKHLCKPTSVADIAAAITILATPDSPLALKPLLAQLADTTGCRYTSLLRFERDRLVSIWTFDRKQPESDAFPLQMPIEASYCSLVRASGQLVAIENAPEDPRVTGHAKEHLLATYIGVPVVAPDGTVFGTLCSYDATPRMLDEGTRAAVTEAARAVAETIRAQSD